LDEAVRKGRFPVINMCDDAEVTNVFHEFVLDIRLSSEVVLKRSEEPFGEIYLLIINYFFPKISFFFSPLSPSRQSPHPGVPLSPFTLSHASLVHHKERGMIRRKYRGVSS
jgi:hypothetical protein